MNKKVTKVLVGCGRFLAAMGGAMSAANMFDKLVTIKSSEKEDDSTTDKEGK